MIRLLLIFLLTTMSLNLQAQEFDLVGDGSGGFQADLGFFYLFDDRNKSDKANSSQLTYDLRLGYSFPSGFAIGVLYVSESETRKYTSVATPTSNRNETHKRTHTGLYAAYSYGYSYVNLAYIFNASWEASESGVSVSYSDSKGIQLDFGLEFLIGSGIYIGPRLSYKNISYGKSNTGSGASTLSPALNRTSLDPIFNLGYKF